MREYRWLLMDADNTLFDFNAAEEFAHPRTGPFTYAGTCPRARLLPPRPRRGGRGGGMVR